MTKTLIDVDDAALDAAMRILGTRTKRETINRALARVLEEHARREAIVMDFELAESGVYARALERSEDDGFR